MAERLIQGILSIDQGTTSSRAIVFSEDGHIVCSSQQEFPQHYPAEGWVEHDPEDIWQTTLTTAQKAFQEAEAQGVKVVAIGITNQRETTLVWDRETGKCVHNAIVWQDRRTTDFCVDLQKSGAEGIITEKTGLLLDPYFSASKITWILDNTSGARSSADQGNLAFGTVDSFLIWRLTGGKVHATDTTNASRTSLFNINTLEWDSELLDIFKVPASLLPDVKDCADDYGMTSSDIFGREIPIYGVAGDQQAAAFGQCCFNEGDVKSTYGTGCFVLLNTGETRIKSQNRLLSTVAYTLNGKATYALEGSIFIAGAAMQWLRDELKVIDDAAKSEQIARSMDGNNGVYLVPAFTGLGAPYWDPNARAAIFGMTRGSGQEEFVRAALESVCYQTFDLFEAMAKDGLRPASVRVDGGMVANNWLLQFLANILGITINRPTILETTALGAARLAGLKAGIWPDLGSLADQWQSDFSCDAEADFTHKDQLIKKWHKAVQCTREFGN